LETRIIVVIVIVIFIVYRHRRYQPRTLMLNFDFLVTK